MLEERREIVRVWKEEQAMIRELERLSARDADVRAQRSTEVYRLRWDIRQELRAIRSAPESR